MRNNERTVTAVFILSVALIIMLFILAGDTAGCDESEDITGTYRIPKERYVYVEEKKNNEGRCGIYDAYGKVLFKGRYAGDGRTYIAMKDEEDRVIGLIFVADGICCYSETGEEPVRAEKVSEAPVR